MNTFEFSVFLVDDDFSVLHAWDRLLGTKGYRVQAFTSSAEFLNEHDPSIAGCIVVDFTMPGLGGLSLQKTLAVRNDVRPIIFVSGRADLASGVEAMRAGAIDFLEKPVDPDDLLAAIERAKSVDRAKRQIANDCEAIRARLNRLSDREHDVLKHVIAGHLNKQTAYALGIVEKTVKVHRARMMTKMGVHTVVDLVRMTEKIGLQPDCLEFSGSESFQSEAAASCGSERRNRWRSLQDNKRMSRKLFPSCGTVSWKLT
jgi:FixJ family two-component response regulator